MAFHTYRDEAIVLHSYKLGEADRIIVMLGRNRGQIRAVAKGVRRPTSKFGSRLGPFNRVELQAHHGRNLDTLTQVELRSGYADPISANYEAFTAAKVVAEVAAALTEAEPETDSRHYQLLHGALAALAKGVHPPELIASSYQLRAMSVAGWTPALENCALCGSSTNVTFFAADQGGFVCRNCVAAAALPATDEVRRLCSQLYQGDWQSAVQSGLEERANAAKIAAAWTQWHLERRLRSIPFLKMGEN